MTTLTWRDHDKQYKKLKHKCPCGLDFLSADIRNQHMIESHWPIEKSEEYDLAV